MKTKKAYRLFVIILALCISLTFASAAEPAVSADDTPSLSLSGAITEYFSMRNDVLNGVLTTSTTATAELNQDAVTRAASLRDFWESVELYLISATAEQTIEEVTAGENGEVFVKVYEWTWLDYNEVDANAPATDQMGFGIEHKLVLSGDAETGYIVTEDGYDEAHISNYTSPYFVPEEVPETIVSAIESNGSAAPAATTSGLNYNGMPNLTACLDYANQWGGTKRNSSVYGSSPADCCNFVSQCLSAGGFSDDPVSTATRDIYNQTTQWWNSRNGGVTYSSPYPWRVVGSFVDYWGARYSLVNINSSMSNVYPGNPVITNGEGHVAICVGYSASGTPLITGHTSDVIEKSLKIGSASGDYGKTLLILTGYCSGSHRNGSYAKTAQQHWRVCSVCNSGTTTPSDHTFIYNGKLYVCSICKYQTNTTVLPDGLSADPSNLSIFERT